MDTRNLRIMQPYPDNSCADDTVYIDEYARGALHIDWGQPTLVVGRRKYQAKIAQLKPEDVGAQVVRMNQDMLDKVYCCVGDEILLYNL